jgi:hypothetical protein
MAEVQRGFGPPPEVTRFFEDKGWKPAFSYKDVFGDEHANAFSVAKVTELELGTLFKNSIGKALAEGRGFETWRKQVVEDLTRAGWGKPRLVEDHLTEGGLPGRMVNFTAPGRLQTIFWGNMASARSAGQWERAQRTKRALPYFLYLHTTSAHPRKDHLQWVGIIRPVDDPIWASIFPPNGWRCKCAVRQISAREAEALLAREWKEGDTVRYTSEAPVIELRTLVNKRTGEVLQVPVGCDPGWGGNPGLARVKGMMRAVEQQLVQAAPEDATKTLEALWQSPWTKVVTRLPEAEAKQVWLPAGVSKQLQAEMAAKSPVVAINGVDVVARANLDGRYKDGRGFEDLTRLPRTIAEGVIVADANPRRRGLIWNKVKSWWRAVVTKSDGGLMRVVSMHQRPESAARRAIEEAARK